jgi:hypothetical protein
VAGESTMILYHATTPRKIERYQNTRTILMPVRGFDTMEAAELWGRKTMRTKIVKFESNRVHKLPDHHNKYGRAFWAEENISEYEVLENRMFQR